MDLVALAIGITTVLVADVIVGTRDGAWGNGFSRRDLRGLGAKAWLFRLGMVVLAISSLFARRSSRSRAVRRT